MIMRKIALSFFFITSYLPLYVFLIILQWKSICHSWENKNYGIAIFIISFLLVACIISIAVPIALKKSNYAFNWKRIEGVENSSDSLINYIFAYIVPLISVGTSDDVSHEVLIVNALLFFMIWYLYIKTNLLYLNPTLAFVGFLPYKTKNGIVLTDLSFDELRDKERLKIPLHGGVLVPGLFIAKKKDNL